MMSTHLVPSGDELYLSVLDLTEALSQVNVTLNRDESIYLISEKWGALLADSDQYFNLQPDTDYVLKMMPVLSVSDEQKLSELKPVVSFAKRDFLLQIQNEMQSLWRDSNAFEVDAPSLLDSDDSSELFLEDYNRPEKKDESFFVTFPFPYMNGALHLGHAFSLSKAEFAASYQRLQGKRVLFPFGFHATGMPIKASADKLRNELFGSIPSLSSQIDSIDLSNGSIEHKPLSMINLMDFIPSQCSNISNIRIFFQFPLLNPVTPSQWDVMSSVGVPLTEIPRFVDPYYWLDYFPPRAMEDINEFGAKIDWRRSFLTTEINPYYDQFVRWQFHHLKTGNKIKFGTRYTMYSYKDEGACLDHDRLSGEGVLPTEYTLVKLPLIDSKNRWPSLPQEKKVYLVAATTKPETIYAQTNCWVLPNGQYGFYDMKDDQIFICTPRAARNLAAQHFTSQWGKCESYFMVTGQDLIGLMVIPPLTMDQRPVPILPMLSISITKGTGIVISVPDQSIDDYLALKVLVDKPAFCQMYNLDHDKPLSCWSFSRVIEHTAFPNTSPSRAICNLLKIKSPNDHTLITKAKESLSQHYLSPDNKMILGPYKDQLPLSVRSQITSQLISHHHAHPYAEPSSLVISRSNDECVVALLDQWYLDYGEESWKSQVQLALDQMNLFSNEMKSMFNHSLSWLSKWACSRSYGLGTRFPFDPTYLIESLSDSTIYMAYYTFCHWLHLDIRGQLAGKSQLSPSMMTIEIWDYLFFGHSISSQTLSTLPTSLLSNLKHMRHEFLYWYPLDLRVSGKDLVNNHLMFSLYNHVAIFPSSQWPRSFRLNGHALLNKAKMSKSTGNFITLRQGIARFSADAMRFALADAGDGIDDANFTYDLADSAILKLYTQFEWIKDILLNEKITKRPPNAPFHLIDRLFSNAINLAIEHGTRHYSMMEYKDALKHVFFNLQNARDEYQVALNYMSVSNSSNDQINGSIDKLDPTLIHQGLIDRFIRVQVILLTPICPHWCEYIWSSLLGQKGFIINTRWPSQDAPIDQILLKQYQYLEKFLRLWRLKKPIINSSQHCLINIQVATQYPIWHQKMMAILSQLIKNEKNGELPKISTILVKVRQDSTLVPFMSQVMPLVRILLDQYKLIGSEAFQLLWPWPEAEFLVQHQDYIKNAIGVDQIVIEQDVDNDINKKGGNGSKTVAVPGSPIFKFKISTKSG